MGKDLHRNNFCCWECFLVSFMLFVISYFSCWTSTDSPSFLMSLKKKYQTQFTTLRMNFLCFVFSSLDVIHLRCFAAYLARSASFLIAKLWNINFSLLSNDLCELWKGFFLYHLFEKQKEKKKSNEMEKNKLSRSRCLQIFWNETRKRRNKDFRRQSFVFLEFFRRMNFLLLFHDTWNECFIPTNKFFGWEIFDELPNCKIFFSEFISIYWGTKFKKYFMNASNGRNVLYCVKFHNFYDITSTSLTTHNLGTKQLRKRRKNLQRQN